MNCIDCDKWKNHQEKILMKCESIFDMHIEMCMFEKTCKKTCPFVDTEKDSENS